MARLQRVVEAGQSGRVREIDNRKIARIAKFAGAPDDPAAGLQLHVRTGDHVEADQPLLTLHADTESEINYAMEYARSVGHGIRLEV